MSKHQYEYRRAMDSIHVTPEWEEHMVNNLMNWNGQAEKHTHRAHRLGLVAVAAAACLTIGAGAAEAATGAVSDFFAPLFGTSHTEIIDSIGYPVGVSDTAGGVTITADAIIGDANNVCVIYTLKREGGWDEVTDESHLLFEDSTFDFHVESKNPIGWGAHGGSWFIDEDPDDDVIQFVEQRTVDDGTPIGSAKETLKNLCIWDDDAQESKVLVKGKWTLRFDLRFEDMTTQFPAGQAVDFLDAPGVITDITLSPIAFHVSVDLARTEFDLNDNYRYLDGTSEALDQLPVLLRLKDGREIDLGYYAGGSVELLDDQTKFTKSSLFDEVIPLEDMESITVCGVEIPLR